MQRASILLPAAFFLLKRSLAKNALMVGLLSYDLAKK